MASTVRRRKRTVPPARVFLAHASHDRAAASAVNQHLVDGGWDVWYSRKRITAGSWLKEIGQALARSNILLLLLSPAAAKSKWVQRELDYALTHDQYDGRILVAALAPANLEDLTWALSGEQIIQLHPHLNRRLPALVRALKRVKRLPHVH